MGIDRVSFLTSSTRKTGFVLKAGFCLTVLVCGLTACAQQSDLMKMEKGLQGKITKLDKEKKALAQVLKQANQDIVDARTALEQQKAELNDEIMKARAQLNSELRNLRDEDLPKKIGDLETQIHQVSKQLDNGLKQQGQVLNALKERQEQRETELSAHIVAVGQNLERVLAQQRKAVKQNLEQALEQQGKTMKQQFAAFQGSLGQFKKALTEVNKRLDQEGKRATGSEAKIRQAFDKRQQAFRAKLDSDTQALKTYLETDVKTAIESINAAMNENNRNLKVDVDAQVTRLSGVNTKLNSQGKGLEQTAKRIEQLAKRIEQLQGQYAALTKKLDADMKSLHGYLDKDVRPSLESIAKAFGQEKNRISQDFIKVKSDLQRVEQTSTSNVTRAQKQLDSQAKYVQELGATVAGMREVLDSMAGTLGTRTDQQINQLGQLTARMERLEKEQGAEAAKQASNTQAVSNHLKEVTASVESVGRSFEQFKDVVSTKLNEQTNRLEAQGRRVSESMGASSAVPNLQKALKANVTQLNALTTSVAQLKDVVKAMGQKLGSKVDAHESQLIEVEQSLKDLKQPARSEQPSSP